MTRIISCKHKRFFFPWWEEKNLDFFSFFDFFFHIMVRFFLYQVVVLCAVKWIFFSYPSHHKREKSYINSYINTYTKTSKKENINNHYHQNIYNLSAFNPHLSENYWHLPLPPDSLSPPHSSSPSLSVPLPESLQLSSLMDPLIHFLACDWEGYCLNKELHVSSLNLDVICALTRKPKKRLTSTGDRVCVQGVHVFVQCVHVFVRCVQVFDHHV